MDDKFDGWFLFLCCRFDHNRWRFRLRWLISLMVDGGFDHGELWWVTKFRYGEGVGQISMGSDMVNNY